MAVVGTTKAEETPKRGGSRLWLSLWLAGALVVLGALSPVILVLALVGLMPAIVAGICDRHPSRYTTITVGAFNVSGFMPWLPMFLESGGRQMPEAFREGVPIMVMYGAAAAGWVIYYGLPAIFEAVRSAMLAKERDRLGKLQDALRDTWGDTIDGGAGKTAAGGPKTALPAEPV